jgi:hypothetical protein
LCPVIVANRISVVGKFVKGEGTASGTVMATNRVAKQVRGSLRPAPFLKQLREGDLADESVVDGGVGYSRDAEPSCCKLCANVAPLELKPWTCLAEIMTGDDQ